MFFLSMKYHLSNVADEKRFIYDIFPSFGLF